MVGNENSLNFLDFPERSFMLALYVESRVFFQAIKQPRRILATRRQELTGIDFLPIPLAVSFQYAAKPFLQDWLRIQFLRPQRLFLTVPA